MTEFSLLHVFIQVLTERVSLETRKVSHEEPEGYFRIENSGMFCMVTVILLPDYCGSPVSAASSL